MRAVILLSTSLCLICAHAGARSPRSEIYPQFTSPKLVPGEGFQGIKGAKKLIVVFDQYGLLPKNACPASKIIPIYSFFDGIHTLASLEDVGFQVTKYDVQLCTDSKGRINQWAFTMVLTEGVSPNETTYQLSAVSGPMFGPTTTFILLTHYSETGELVRYDASSAVGTWAIKLKPN